MALTFTNTLPCLP